MTPERWAEIERLYGRALEQNEAQRAAFLETACAGDEALRREVESLLAQDASRDGFLNNPAAELLGESTISPLALGSSLGPYRIEAPLGAGGMGEVYKARDTRLGRAVAIKISRERFSERFEREARAISALNHPYICTLYDVGPNYLVMELVEGETLAERLRNKPLPMDLVLRYGAQIAEGLAAAHARGIIHRDLKPANIMIAKSGVKILDFGLARFTNPGDTLTASRVVMGTPAYMPPEQIEGKECDARTDIFALGLVLYEMSTGKRALSQGEPAPVEGLPTQFAHVVERCLERDPENRWQSASDIKAELEWAGKHQTLAQAPARNASVRLAWGSVAVACVLLVAFGVAMLRRNPVPASERPAQFTLSFLEQQTGTQLGQMPVPSPDGQYFVFSGNRPGEGSSLWIRPLDSVEARPLPGTAGADGAIIWSPDGRWIGFYADKKLKKVSPSGGPSQTIAELPGFQDAAWSAQGDIIYRYTNRAPLFRIRESGGPPEQVTRLDSSLTENSHRGPQFLPDGRRFLFTTRCGQRENNALYIGSLDSPEVKRLMPVQSSVSYVPPRIDRPGALLYYRDGALVQQSFDPDAEKVIGDPVPVIDRVAYNAPSIQAFFRVSADGRVAIIRPVGANYTRLTWFDRNGMETGTVGPEGDYFQPRISPNGDRVAFSRPDDQTGNRDVWYTEIARGIVSRLTVHVANDWYPVWSPDGKQILFGSDRDGGTQMHAYLKRSMDPGSNESSIPDIPEEPYDWSHDGRWLSFGENNLWVASVAGDHKPFPFLSTPFLESNGRFSPDGKWMAYVSNETGRFEVYVRPFAGGPATGEKIQVSNSGGDFPVWGPSGQELFYMSGNFDIHVVSTRNLGQSGSAPLPARLFRACPGTVPQSAAVAGNWYAYAFDTSDGQRFLVNCLAEPPGNYVVLMNWAAKQ